MTPHQVVLPTSNLNLDFSTSSHPYFVHHTVGSAGVSTVSKWTPLKMTTIKTNDKAKHRTTQVDKNLVFVRVEEVVPLSFLIQFS